MSTEIQRTLLSTLAEVWALSPDVRLGQLMAHLGFLGECHAEHGLGDIEDDELLAILYRHRAELTARIAGTTIAVQNSGGAPISISGSAMSVSPPMSDVGR